MWTKSLQSDTLAVGYQLGYYLGWYSLVVTSFEVSLFQMNWVETQPDSELLVGTHPILDKTLQFSKQVNDFQNPQWYFAKGKKKAQQIKLYN